MAIETINIGSYANDGTGDDLRTAFEKVNNNFTLLQTDVNVVNGENLATVTMTNCNSTIDSTNIVVSSTAGLVKGTKVRVSSGTGAFANNTYITEITGLVTFTVSAEPTTQLVNATVVAEGVGIFAQRASTNFQYKSLTSSDNSILLNPTDKTIDILSNSKLSNDQSPTLSADLNLNNHTIYGGDVQTTVFGIDVRQLAELVALMTSGSANDVDLGNFVSPPSIVLDMGGFDPTSNQGTSLDFGSF